MLKSIKPKYNSKLIRIGSKFDGGYLVEKKSYKNAELLISFGIFNNWDFEKKFKKPFLAFDDQLDFKFVYYWFLKRCISISSLFFYLKNKKNFKKAFVGIKPYTFNEIIAPLRQKKIFLKIDIEGNEYSILDDIILNQKKIIGIVIEFHDVEKHLNEIEDFICNIELENVHVHANNFGGLSHGKIPNVLEITFSRFFEKSLYNVQLPHYLDKPNNKFEDEIRLIFE